MRGSDGTIHTDPIKINRALKDYYTDFYKRDALDSKEANDFLTKLQLPILEPDQLLMLNSPITTEEVR